MKLKTEMVITQLGDDYMAVPVGKGARDFKAVVRLNRTGADLWKGLEAGMNRDQLAALLTDNYDGVSRAEAEKAVDDFVKQLSDAGILEV